MTVNSETQTFTIKTSEIGDKPTLDAPSFALVEKPFKVRGTTPEPNQEVWIELEKIGLDEKIASGVSNAEHIFEIEVQLTELGFNKIHSEIDKLLWPNPTSTTKNILTLNYIIVGGLALGVFLVLWRAGVFKKIGGKK